MFKQYLCSWEVHVNQTFLITNYLKLKKEINWFLHPYGPGCSCHSSTVIHLLTINILTWPCCCRECLQCFEGIWSLIMCHVGCATYCCSQPLLKSANQSGAVQRRAAKIFTCSFLGTNQMFPFKMQQCTELVQSYVFIYNHENK